MMLKTHFSRVLNLHIRASEELTSSRSSHSTSYTHFALTTNLSPRNRSIRTHHIPKDTRSSQSSKNTCRRKIATCMQMIKHGRNNTTTTTSRSCNHTSASCIMFAHSKGISINKSSTSNTCRAIAISFD